MFKKYNFKKTIAAILAACTITTCGAGAASANAASNGQQYGVHVDSGYLALRNGKSFNAANEIGRLNNSDSITVLDKNDSTYWYVYSPKYDTYGYVNANFIYKKDGSSSKKSGQKYTVSVSDGYLALRTAPAYNSANEIGKLHNGNTVKVIDKSNGAYWYVYAPKLGMNGYVNKDFLKKK